MGLFLNKRVLRAGTLALSALIITVACGDGRAKKRKPVVANPAAQQGKNVPTGNGKPTPPAPTDPDAQKKLADENKKAEEFDKQIAAYLVGEVVDKAGVPAGTYKLNSIVTSLKYMNNTKGWMRAFSSGKFWIDSSKRPQLSEDVNKGLGMSPDDPDSVGNMVLIPVDLILNSDLSVATTMPVDFTTRVSSTMDSKGTSVTKVNNRVSGNEAAKPKASVVDILNTVNAAKENKGADGKLVPMDIKYTVADGKRQIDMRLRKVDGNKLHVVFEILESNDPKMIRTIVLIYDLSAAATSVTTGDDSSTSRKAGTEDDGDDLKGTIIE